MSLNGLPENWEVKKLGDLVEKQTIKALPQDFPDAKFIGMDCIEPHTMSPAFLYDFKDFKSAGNYFKAGQVLYGRMRPYLNKVYKAEFSGACSGEFIVLECSKDFSPDLLQYILHSRGFVRFVNEKTSGDRPRVSFDEISDYPILLPPIEEQERIVAKIEELFPELDAGVESLKKAKAQLKTYRQSVLKSAFQGKLTNGNIVDGELPTGWKWKRIDEIGRVETGSTPSKKQPQYYSSDFPFYKPTDLAAGFNVRVASDNLSELGLRQARFLPENSILVTCIGATIGKTGIIRRAGASNQQINAIVPNDSNPNFIYYQAIAPDFQTSIKDNASSTTLPILNKSKFQKLEMVICPQDEQHRIVEEIESRLSVCDKLEENIAASLKQSKALRQSILKQAFEGKLVSTGSIS